MKTSSIAIALSLLLIPLCAQAQTGLQVPGNNSTAAPTPVDPQKDKVIRELLTKTHEVEMAQERILQGLSGMKQFMPRVPQKYWDEYRARISLDDVRNQMVEVYAKQFTTDEVKAILAFYNTPAGQKLSSAALPILRASMDVSQAVSQRAGQIVAKALRSDQFLQQPRAAASLGIPQAPSASSLGPNPFASNPAVPTPVPAASPSATTPAPQ